jgi:hypothetical protein
MGQTAISCTDRKRPGSLPELRLTNRQRALYKDPILISSWFELVEQTKAKYSILEEDVYNFDEAGFMISKITTQLVVTESERRGQPKAI